MKKYEEIYQRLKEEILDGYRRQGERLPSIRASVRQYHVSQTSVERAYAQLQLEGYIRSFPQRGYYVALTEENRALHAAMLQLSPIVHQPKIRYDFRSQSILAEESELCIWKQYLKQAMSDATISSYGEARGEYALRVSLMRHASFMRGVLAHEEQMVIGASVQALLYQVCGLFSDKKIVAIQQHVYLQARRVFEDYGMEVADLPYADKETFFRQLDTIHPDILFVHSPSLFEQEWFDEAAKQELLTYAKVHQLLLIEDDHNGELTYLREKTMALTGMDSGVQSLYMGSFSRILLPALRISYMILPKNCTKTYQQQLSSYSPSASKLEQLAFASYIADGHLRRRITRLKRQYRLKHMRLMEITAKTNLSCIQIEESFTRYHFAYSKPIEPFLQRLQQEGIAIDAVQDKSISLSFAALPLDQLEEALTALAALV